MTAATPSNRSITTGIARYQMPALIAGILGAIACVIGYFVDPATFFRSYLPGYIFWFQIVAGSLGVLCLQYVTGGEWGILIRRPLGAAARTIIWMVVLFIPIVLGMKYLYIWTDHTVVANDASLTSKAGYLNITSFLIRTAVYFALWILWAWRIRYLSLRFYEDRSPYTELSRRKWAASGLVMIVLSMTFAGIDWMMSIEPKWSSTMYGINFFIGAGLAAYAFVTFFLTRLARTPAMHDILKPNHFRDLGNLMLAFVMLWAYTAFSEFLLIWYANLKEEIPHFLVRRAGAWGALAIFLIIFHFFLPFFMLLMRAIKDRPGTIGVVAIIILVARYAGIYWLTEPSWSGEHFHYSWMALASLVGVGGLWLYLFIGQLKGQTIIPIHETWVDEALREGAVKHV
ncbi:MAG TPA: hypothetical protein VF381_12545 [Thermoanaerobaculia bacterium]